jgi:uncharacterized membrane protein
MEAQRAMSAEDARPLQKPWRTHRRIKAMDVAVDRPRPAIAPAGLKRMERLPGIDEMRGLVIVLMALDHVRDFFDADALRFSPTDLAHTYPALFFTRFATHYCAPSFALLAGIAAFLHGEKLADRAALARFLWTRGLWLIFLDAVLISPIWTLQFGKIEFGTLWAIGCGMIALSFLARLPPKFSLTIGAAILLAHDLLDDLHASAFGAFGPFWSLLHEPGPLPFGLNGSVLYPVLPWIGVVAFGYGLGPLFLADAGQRRRVLTRLGVVALALFAILRGGNFYGDPHPWSLQPSGTFTALSFLNVSKYPPSLLYALVTLGPALILLVQLERVRGVVGGVLAVFGRTPLFFYILHLYAALGAAAALAFARGFDLRQIEEFAAKGVVPENFGVGLLGTYVAWIALVAALYPLCRWFGSVKQRRRDWWLSYL